MNPDGDDDFNPLAPLAKKVKKNNPDDKPKRGKKIEKPDSSPKRKTPAKRKAAKSPKPDSKKAKKGGKGAAAKKAEDSDEEEEKAGDSEMIEIENQDPNEDSKRKLDSDDDEEESFDPTNGKSKKKRESSKPPAKGKKNANSTASKEEGFYEILDYMKKQNRPYSLLNIYDNLHAKIKKPQCQRALDQLSEAGEIHMKEYGKSKIYLMNQKNIPDVDEQEVDKLNKTLNRLKEEFATEKEEYKEMQTSLKLYQAQPTNAEVDNEIEKYTKLLEEANKKMVFYESGNYPKISDEDINKAETNKKLFETHYKKRKRICMDMIGGLAESMEMKLALLMEDIGIETD
jgi:Fe2+ or Zn2+ uptake regulation protein